jgi:hypothetical protein
MPGPNSSSTFDKRMEEVSKGFARAETANALYNEALSKKPLSLEEATRILHAMLVLATNKDATPPVPDPNNHPMCQ